MNRGDIVLIKFPFTDLSSDKVRPALVVSSDAYSTTTTNPDAIFIYISAVIDSPKSADIVIEERHPEFRRSGLKKASVIKCDKIVTLSKILASKRLGEVGPTIIEMVNTKLSEILGLS